jgi:hypothetical protein
MTNIVDHVFFVLKITDGLHSSSLLDENIPRVGSLILLILLQIFFCLVFVFSCVQIHSRKCKIYIKFVKTNEDKWNKYARTKYKVEQWVISFNIYTLRIESNLCI